MHNLRAPQHKPLRAHKEEQVPGVQPTAREEVLALAATVPRGPAQEQDHTLRHEARERATQAAGTQRYQGRRTFTPGFSVCRLRFFFIVLPDFLIVIDDGKFGLYLTEGCVTGFFTFG